MDQSRKISIVVFIFIGLFLFSLTSNVQAATCTNKKLKGNYGMIVTGDRINGDNPGPRADVGLFTADGSGNISGLLSKSKNGTIGQNRTFTGTYTVDTDCTGYGSITDSEGEVMSFDFIIVDSGKTVFGLQTDDGRVTTFQLTKQ